MKKVIKNYLAKLQENDKKGFSLVELIIVMAIMAILVGIVASQVLPYMEKSRQSKDQQVLSSICTDVVSAIAQSDEAVGTFSTTVDDLTASNTDSSIASVGKQFVELHGTTTTTGLKLKSSAAKAGNSVKVDYQVTGGKGTVTVYVNGATADKLTVVSD